ncbi:hypothetical protein RB195_016621 [Necator americanus]
MVSFNVWRNLYHLLCKNPGTLTSIRTKVWAPRFPPVQPSDVPLYDKVVDAMRVHAENPTKIALMSGDGEADPITYKELLFQTEAAASFLSKCGIRREVACLVMSNSPAFIASHLSVLKCGGLVTVAKTSASRADLEQQIKETNSSFIFTDEDALDKLLRVAENCSNVKTIFCVRRTLSRNKLPKGVVDFKRVIAGPITETKNENYKSTDTAMISYTTTSDESLVGMVLTHRNISTAADIYNECLRRIMKRAYMYTDLSQEKLLHCSSFSSLFGLLCMDIALIAGFTSIILKEFDPTLFQNSLHSHMPRLLITEPKNIVSSLKYHGTNAFKTNSLEYVLCNGPAVGKRVRKGFLEKFPSVKYMTSGAGLLDGAPGAMIPNIGDRENTDCVSCAVPTCETKVVCAGRELGVDRVGEICLRGPTVMQGYVGDSEAVDANGWFHTGEIGHIDQHGNIFIDGRLDDFTDVDGQQVCLNELEDILLCHPSIVDAAVVGIENKELGHLLKAFVVQCDETLTPDEVQLYIRGQISESYKHLSGGVEFIDAIPRAADGHILRNKLAKLKAAHEEKTAAESLEQFP